MSENENVKDEKGVPTVTESHPDKKPSKSEQSYVDMINKTISLMKFGLDNAPSARVYDSLVAGVFAMLGAAQVKRLERWPKPNKTEIIKPTEADKRFIGVVK